MTKPEPLVVPKVLKLQYYQQHLENRVSRQLTAEDAPSLEELILKLCALAQQHKGVGIAAPQVGINVQLAVVLDVEGDKAHALINPEITVFGGRDLIEQEGCLSLPPSARNMTRVTRSEIVHLESGTIEDPAARVKTVHKGFEARVIQHEVDHLNGVFFINRVGKITRDIVVRKHEKFLKRYERA